MHNARGTGKARADQEGDHDRSIYIHAHERRGITIHRGGAHSATSASARDEELKHHHQNQRRGDHEEVQERDAGLAHHDHPLNRKDLRHLHNSWAEGELNDVLQDEAHSDRRNQRGQLRGTAEWSIGKPLNDRAHDRHHHNRANEEEQDRGDQCGDVGNRPFVAQ